MEAKFKFCDDVKAFLYPPSSVNVRTPVAIISVSPTPSGASGSLSTTDVLLLK